MKLFERVPRAVARTYPAVGDAVNPRERPSRARGHHVVRSCRRVRSWLRRRRAFWRWWSPRGAVVRTSQSRPDCSVAVKIRVSGRSHGQRFVGEIALHSHRETQIAKPNRVILLECPYEFC